MTEHQPREQAVLCPHHDRRHPVTTWNHSGLCDRCESQATT